MAAIPVPRSRSQIVGQMVDALLSRLGIPQLQVGDPSLGIIEAAAQSDLRSSQDIFGMLNVLSLDRATGQALDRIGADEQVLRQGQTSATGRLDIGDSSFTKIATRIYQGGSAPIIGTVSLAIEDGGSLPATGSVYVGRGTTNYEGPLAYTAATDVGSYWTLTLSTGTTKFHNLGESVVLAQGGVRAIPVGTLARTPQGNAGVAIQVATTFAASIPDGETLVTDVPAVSRVPGSIGQVVQNSVTQFVTSPFNGATVNNPAGFSNGFDTETDQDYREDIRNARNGRTKGTDLAIETGVIGITSLDENNRVLSANLVSRQGEPDTLYIDDGTGYEEKTEGIAFEVVTDSAIGGEQYFQLANGRPVSKAFLSTALSAPFALVDGARLTVAAGGIETTHLFPASDFRSVGNASAYEVVASINSDPELLWAARTANGGTQVSIFSKADVNEDVRVVAQAAGLVDSNEFLGFPPNPGDTLWLYRNDRLLNKDGSPAVLTTKPQTGWSSISSGDTLLIGIDGITLTITVTDSDFVNAGTQYVSVNTNNSLSSWAQVFNFKIPGVTTTVSNGALNLESNLGRAARASVTINGGNIGAALFTETSAQGADQDYTFDRNLGQIKLNEPLVALDRLTAGSLATRGFLETPSFTTLTVAGEATTVSGQLGAELWVVVDGDAVIVKTAVGPGTTLTVTNPATPSWGNRVRYNSAASANLFGNVLLGDWAIATDLNFSAANKGAYRVVNVDTNGTWIEIEQNSSWSATQSSFGLATGGLKIVRTPQVPQRLFLGTAGNPYTALSLATAIQPQLQGGTAEVYRTTRLRLRTNTFLGGDIAVVASNGQGALIGFGIANATTSGISHLANLVSGHSQIGTPAFTPYTVSTVTSTTAIDYGSGTAISSGNLLVGLKTLADGGGERYGNKNFVSPLDHQSGTVLTLREPVVEEWLPQQRFFMAHPYALSARDQLGITIDGDEVQKRYVINMYRKVTPASNTYGATNTFKDADNGGQSLAEAFGTGFVWSDFAVHMQARQLAAGILWRYYRHGPEGDQARVAYNYPSAPNAAVNLVVDSRTDDNVDITIQLGSSAARSVTGLRNSSFLGVTTLSGPDSNNLYQYLYVLNLPVASGTRAIRLNYTAGSGTRSGTVTGGTSGATANVVSDPGGYVVITTVSGTFSGGETLSFTGGGSATASGSQYGYTTLTLTLPTTTPAVTDSGLQVNNAIWLQSTDVNFTSGPKVIAARTATTISYADIATTTASISGTLTVSRDTAGEVSLTGSSAVSGDLLSIGSGTGLPTAFVQTIKTATLTTARATGQSPVVNTTGTTLGWYPLNSTAALQLFPLNAAVNTTSAIITSVGAIANTPITGFESTPGTISWATYEAPSNGLGANNGGLGPWYYLVDGVNWVRSTNTPSTPSTDFIFTFKDAVTGGLATGTDWQNEDVRIVPITAANIVDYLDVAAVGGLFSVTEIAVARDGNSPQITTITAGSSGSVQASGGTGNALTAAVVGNAITTSGTTVAAFPVSEVNGLTGRTWVSLDNTVVAPKSIITSSTALTAILVTGQVTLSATKTWKYSQDVGNALTAGATFQVEKQGRFVSYIATATPTGFSSVREGDWVVLDPHVVNSAYAAAGTMNSLNRGVFRVVRTSVATNQFWIENENVLEESGVTVDVAFLDYDSVLPGDGFLINTALWGIDNLGTWTVARIDTSNQFQFFLDIGTRSPANQGAVAALGTNSGLVQVYEAVPGRLIKRVVGIAPNATVADVKFDTIAGARGVSAGYGTILSSLDKLGFGLDEGGDASNPVPGVDGYSNSVGLIGEANRVVYGDEAQSSSYPGIAAAGANINISGPLVRRIQTSFALRVKTGISTQDITDKVQSAVAAVINNTGVGEAVAISALIQAAMSVNGVIAVTVLSPAYGTGNDIIAIQPYEKPLVIDSQQDAQIGFVGV